MGAMKLKERISWLVKTVQQSLFPHLEECLPMPLTEHEQHLVKLLELINLLQIKSLQLLSKL